MTNSTDNTQEAAKDKKSSKKNKPKGPIRFEAVIPVTIVFVLGFLYMTYFFDSNLRSAIEFGATMVHGAEVNVGKIKTSFFGGSFALYDLQVTDKEKPARNLVQIEAIKLGLLWDALLRAKFVINEASIKNIQAFAPRKKPGRIIPPSESKGSEALAEIEKNVVDQAKTQFNENVLGDVANIVGGADPSEQLKNLQADLKTDVRIKELEKSLAEKKKLWKKRIDDLPNKKELNALTARAKKLKFKGNALQIAKDLQELDKIVKDADKAVKKFNEASKGLNGDVNSFNKSFKDLEKFAQQDIKDIQNRLKIPDLNVADFSKGLFGKMLQERLGGMAKYMAVAREYMPPKKSAEGKTPELIPPSRGKGKDRRFRITTGYPLFWLKKASISSEPNESEFSGKISGEIIDVTSNPVFLGKPAKIIIKGDFPKQEIFGLDILVLIDHTTNEPYEKADVIIGSYPVGSQKLSDSDDVKFIIDNAKGKAIVKAVLKNQTINVNIENRFEKVKYIVDAKSNLVKDILNGVAKGMPVVTLNALATGSWSDINWRINSNLGDEISKGFKREIDAKVAEAKKQVQEYVNNQLKAQKDKLNKQFNEAKNQVTGEINKRKKELDKAKQQAKNQLNKQKKGAKKQQKKKGEEALKKLLGF